MAGYKSSIVSFRSAAGGAFMKFVKRLNYSLGGASVQELRIWRNSSGGYDIEVEALTVNTQGLVRVERRASIYIPPELAEKFESHFNGMREGKVEGK